DDTITSSAGSLGVGLAAAGVGASVAVNVIGGETKAFIADECTHDTCASVGTEVSALAKDAAQTLTVNTGALSADVDLASGLDLTKYGRTDLASLRETEQVTGLSVNASATHNAES